jgi:hypothetical protein
MKLESVEPAVSQMRAQSLTRGANTVNSPWQEFGWGGLDEPGPQTEDSIERGFRGPEAVDDELGLSESIDPDDVGDIADEGTGHRG